MGRKTRRAARRAGKGQAKAKPRKAARPKRRPAVKLKARARPRQRLTKKPVRRAAPKPVKRAKKATRSTPKRRPAPKPKRAHVTKPKPRRAPKPQPAPQHPAARKPNRAHPRVSVFIGASVDGFIAREGGDLDFLEVPGDPKGEDYGYQAFVGEIDAIVMGRKTFEKFLTFKTWPYGKTPLVVLTTRPLPLQPRLRGKVETMADRPAEVVGRLRRRGLKRLYLDGGRTIQGFLRAGVVDEITITRVPVLVGQGVPLFGALPQDVKLKHLETRAFKSGMVQSTYAVRRRKMEEPKVGRQKVEEEIQRRFGAPAAAAPQAAAEQPHHDRAAEVEAPSEPAEVGPPDEPPAAAPDDATAASAPAPFPEPDPAAGQVGEDE